MHYNSRRPNSGPRDHTRPQAPLRRLFHSGMGHHGWRGMARHHGRLAAPGRRPRDGARIRDWRCAAAAHWLGLRQAGHRDAGRSRRNSLYVGGLPQIYQLCHWLDDDAGLLHRVSMGSRGRRARRRLHFSGNRFD